MLKLEENPPMCSPVCAPVSPAVCPAVCPPGSSPACSTLSSAISSAIGFSVADLIGDWWVAHTKARTEKAFAWDMVNAGIGYFLPMVSRVTFSGGRKRRGMQPLFPGYVFLCGDHSARYRALMTHRLCQVIPVTNQAHLRNELCAIESAIKSGLAIELYPFAVLGKRCRVAKGPLQGVLGTVIGRDKATRFVLEVSVLGKGASLEIDADLLEAAE